jgi:Ca2+-binding EF-hand superfamily protein
VKKLSELIKMMFEEQKNEKEATSPKWRELSENEVVLLMKVADPSGDGDLTIGELRRAIAMSQELTAAQKIEARVGGVFEKLEKLMKDKGLRMQDLFLSFGGEDGTITQGELKEGLKKLNQVGARERSEEKRALEAATRKKVNDEMKKREIEAEISRIEMAESSGTAEVRARDRHSFALCALPLSPPLTPSFIHSFIQVLRKFDTLMYERGMRVTDLFRTIDKSGDGLISPDELMMGLRLLAQPCPAATFAHKKALQKEVEAHEKEVKKRSELRHFLTKQRIAVETGAAEVIERLEIYLRNHQLRVSDLFRQIDATGDGALDEQELQECLKGVGIEMNDADIHCLVTFLDSGGNGTVEATELNEAIRNYRRFRWEAQVIDLDADYRNPLHEEFKSLQEIFHSSDLFEDGLGEQDVITGLKRLRGDDFGEDDMTMKHSERKKLREVADNLALHLQSLGKTDMSAVFGGDAHHQHNIKMSEFEKFLVDCREVEKDVTAHDILTQSMGSFDDESTIVSNFTDFTTAEEPLPPPLIELNLSDFDSVASFLDGGDGSIDMKELETAFRMARRSVVEAELKKQGVALMKRLRKLIEYVRNNIHLEEKKLCSTNPNTPAGTSSSRWTSSCRSWTAPPASPPAASALATATSRPGSSRSASPRSAPRSTRSTGTSSSRRRTSSACSSSSTARGPATCPRPSSRARSSPTRAPPTSRSASRWR